LNLGTQALMGAPLVHCDMHDVFNSLSKEYLL
jgi:hypothetical protein